MQMLAYYTLPNPSNAPWETRQLYSDGPEITRLEADFWISLH